MILRLFREIKKHREDKRLAIIKAEEEKRELEIKRVQTIKGEIDVVEERAKIITDNMREEGIKNAKKENSVCSKCGSENINDRIKRHQGEIEGSSIGHGSYGLFGSGSSYSRGSIKGEFDTNEVNKCNDCGHEWKKVEYNSYFYSSNYVEHIAHQLLYGMEKHYDIINCTFDPLDISEEFNSLEEKKESMRKSVYHEYRINEGRALFEGISFDTFIEIVKMKEIYSKDYLLQKIEKTYNEDYLKEFGMVKLSIND